MLNAINANVSILVNGNNCKQYTHEGRFYIEAKDSSEYEIKLENNSANRVLAVVSVDGLDVLTGKTASVNASGYIIEAWSSYRIKGYRYDNDTVGAFKFVKKNESYAATKGKQSKKNCGIIGVILYEEKQITPWLKVESDKWDDYSYNQPIIPWKNPVLPLPNVMFRSSNVGDVFSNKIEDSKFSNKIEDSNDCLENCLLSMSDGSDMCNYSSNVKRSLFQPMKSSSITPKGFDMGSGWGSAKDSKITEVEFVRGDIVFTTEIYYASRESLIEMGVSLKQEGKVNLPKSFPGGFAKPPVGWKP